MTRLHQKLVESCLSYVSFQVQNIAILKDSFVEQTINGELVRGYQVKGKFAGICAVIAHNHVFYYNYLKDGRKLICQYVFKQLKRGVVDVQLQNQVNSQIQAQFSIAASRSIVGLKQQQFKSQTLCGKAVKQLGEVVEEKQEKPKQVVVCEFSNFGTGKLQLILFDQRNQQGIQEFCGEITQQFGSGFRGTGIMRTIEQTSEQQFKTNLYIGEFWGVELRQNTKFRWIVQDQFQIFTTVSGVWGANGPEGSIVETHSDGTVWNGVYKNGKKDGKGNYTFGDGSAQQGQYTDGKLEGSSQFTSYQGLTMSSSYHRDRLNQSVSGETGSVRYSYSCKNGQISGQFTEELQNGDKFTGRILNGYTRDAVYEVADGTVVKGDMLKSGLLNGFVEIDYPNGNHYKGEVKDGVRYGQGSFTDKTRSLVLEGTFELGYLINGSITQESGDKYSGSFVKEQLQGRGVITKNGLRLFSEFKNGKQVGDQMLVFEDGAKITGQILDFKPVGIVQKDFVGGEIIVGECDNKYQMRGYCMQRIGDIAFEGEFANDLRSGFGIEKVLCSEGFRKFYKMTSGVFYGNVIVTIEKSWEEPWTKQLEITKERWHKILMPK